MVVSMVHSKGHKKMNFHPTYDHLYYSSSRKKAADKGDVGNLCLSAEEAYNIDVDVDSLCCNFTVRREKMITRKS